MAMKISRHGTANTAARLRIRRIALVKAAHARRRGARAPATALVSVTDPYESSLHPPVQKSRAIGF